VRTGRHGRLPIVRRRLAYPHFLGPAPAGHATQENIARSAAKTLPDDEHRVARRRGAVKRVRAFAGNELRRAPRPVALSSPPDLPTLLSAFTPEDPQAAIGGYGGGGAEDVARLQRDFFGRGPARGGPGPQQHAVRAIAVS